ncbi:phosphoribosylglycinamide formyltransferase [Aulographum hederae CBS 113979]|uniref:Phosphoribosylglycinamide formyltransferase n=1 Tax=Aulographum hederae CBS 113979 TaxID=1176131 RepID=A0A6G1GUB2_9PEZI|nr:phosphoribosylglycinamide formyltransferase [Aulographum hederae CBS 113979]
MAPQTKLTVLISGSGTNLQALIDACNNSTLPSTTIVRVISDRKAAYGLQRASNAGIPTHYHNYPSYKKQHPPSENRDESKAREEYDADLASLILADSPDLVVCAGWMRVLSSRYMQAMEAAGVRSINLHPALPGEYPGKDAIQRAHADWQAGTGVSGEKKRTGVMIHYVILEVDEGAWIVQKEIPFVEGEDEDVARFEDKVHAVEHKAIVEGTGKAIEELWKKRSEAK